MVVMKIEKRILIIGNDLTFFQSAKDFMSNSSTEVSYAMSVKEALNYLLSSEYCIVIICIPLSVDSSIEFLRLVRETYLMPILVITPKLRVSEKVALFHAGANACLERPVDAALCVAQARSLVQLYSDAKLTDKKVRPLVFGTELIGNLQRKRKTTNRNHSHKQLHNFSLSTLNISLLLGLKIRNQYLLFLFV